MRKKLLGMLLSLTMVATLFSGCGSKDSSEGGDSSKGKVYYLNFKPEQADDWKALAEEYSKEKNVEVKVVTAAANTYEQTLKSEMAKSEAPTLFQVNGPVGLATWKDYCYDMKDSDVYKQVKSDDFVLKDGDAVQGIAYVIETYGIIYNKTLLAKYCGLSGAKISDASEINSFAK